MVEPWFGHSLPDSGVYLAILRLANSLELASRNLNLPCLWQTAKTPTPAPLHFPNQRRKRESHLAGRSVHKQCWEQLFLSISKGPQRKFLSRKLHTGMGTWISYAPTSTVPTDWLSPTGKHPGDTLKAVYRPKPLCSKEWLSRRGKSRGTESRGVASPGWGRGVDNGEWR